MFQLKNVWFDDNVPQWISRKVSQNHFIILIAHGDLNFNIGNTTLSSLSKGDILLVPAGNTRTGSNGPHPHQKYAVEFEFTGQTDDPLLQLLDNECFHLFKPRSLEYMRQRFAALYRMWRERSSYYDMICHGIMMEILGTVFREIEKQHIPFHKLFIAKEIEKYILLHYREEIKVDTLAALVQRTPNYVTAIFKEIIGQSPIEYVHKIRIATAQDLLLHSNMNVAEVSDYLGFCDPSYFNRIFKKITGNSPSMLLKRKSHM